MAQHENALNEWLKNLLSDTSFNLKLLTGDASFRRYFRLERAPSSVECPKSYVVMDASADKEMLLPFVKIATFLGEQGIHVPRIHAINEKQGFALLDDFGDQLFLKAIASENADSLYRTAITTLIKIQNCQVDPNHHLPTFDQTYMFYELKLFSEWCVSSYLNVSLNSDEEQLFSQAFNQLTDEIEKQPRVLIHRDYHSRNLMVLPSEFKVSPSKYELGVIDFQDAMYGPFTYDLVSLLKDCYIQWPWEKVTQWVRDCYERLPQQFGYSFNEFMRAFDLCGIQRHFKVLGIFCRLYLRDKKPNYLQDLPLTFHYLMHSLERYPEFQSLHELMLRKIQIGSRLA